MIPKVSQLTSLSRFTTFFLKRPIYFNLPCIILQEKRILYQQNSFFSSSCKMLAGHSKWANIRHTKGAKDLERSLVFSRITRLIRLAIKEGGSTNPDLNFKLARVLDQARAANMPTQTIESSIKSIEKAQDNAKPGSVVYSAPGGMFLIVDVLTDNLNRTRSQLASVMKKMNFKETRGSIENIFEEKGVIVAKGDDSQALDHAIEVGAEEVNEEEGFLTFTCAPNDFMAVHQGLKKLNYEIEYAEVDRIPLVMAAVKEDDIPRIKLGMSKCEELDDVLKLHYNFEV